MHTLERRLWRNALATLAATAALAAAGCGDDDAGHDRIEARIQTVQDAFDARDLRAACRGMTERAQLLIAHMAHAVLPSCEQSLRRVRGWMARGDRAAIGPRPTVEAVELDGRTAVATVEQPGFRPYSVRMASASGRWKLNGVFDAGTSSFQEFSDVPPDSGPPPEPVANDDGEPTDASTIVDGESGPCPPIRVDSASSVGEGCTVVVRQAKVDISVLNLFGRMPLAACRLRLTLHVDARGRTSTDDFSVGGPRACGDIRGCGSNLANSRHRAWHGQIERGPDGRLRHRFLDVCLDTCVGVYRGDWTVGMERHGRRWRLSSRRAMVGASGWVFDTVMSSRPSTLAVEEGAG